MTAEPATTASRPRTVSALIWPVLGLILLVAAWWGVTATFEVQTFLLPAPVDVVTAFDALAAEFLKQSWNTTEATLLGFGLSVLVAVLIGAAIASWRPVE